MKLLYLAGSNSIHSHRWINFFAERGHEIHWISFAPTVQPVLPGIHYEEMLSRLPKPIAGQIYARKVRKILQEIKPDLLHAHSAGIYGYVALLTRSHPIVLTAWGTDVLLNPRAFINRLIVTRILKAADLITCDGDNTTSAMIQLGAAPEKIKRILFGTDVKKFSPENRKRKIDGKIRIISFRSLVPVYDVATQLNAFALIHKQAPHTEFTIVGDGPERKRLEKLSKKLGVPDSVRFVGFVSGIEGSQYLVDADIYISTALSDSGLSASTAEAMASGLPVVITNTGDNEKWVENGEGGFVIPTKNPEMLAEKLLFIINNPEKRALYGVHNRKTIEEHNNYYREMEKMEELYEKITAKYQKTR